MAFQTGSQINPALGRVDYTPYMQGAVAGAQSIGQGIASLGQSVGSGIEQFYKQKKENKKIDSAIESTANYIITTAQKTSNPELKTQLTNAANELLNGELSREQRYATAQRAERIADMAFNLGVNKIQEDISRQEQGRIANAALLLSGQGTGPVLTEERLEMLRKQGLSDYEIGAAKQQAAEYAYKLAQTNKTVAETKALGIEKPLKGFKTKEEAKATGQQANPSMEIKVIRLDDGSWDFNPVLPEQSNADIAKLAATAEADSAQILYKPLAQKVEKFAQHKEAISDYDAAIKEVEEGKAFSGAGAQFKVIGAKAVQLLGGTQFNSQLAAYAALSTILANRTLTAGQMLKGSMSNSDRAFLQDMAGGKTPTVDDLKKIRQIYIDMVSKKEPELRNEIDKNFADFKSPQAKAYQKSLYITGGFEDGSSPSAQQQPTTPQPTPTPQQPQAQSLINQETMNAVAQELARRKAAGK